MKKHKGAMDSGYMDMISENHSAPSNLPQEVKHKYYPKKSYAGTEYLDDTRKGIDDQINDSVRKMKNHSSKSMY